MINSYNEQCGDIGEARQVAIDALHDYSFNGETYVYLLMGLNHTLKKIKFAEKNILQCPCFLQIQ